jgi:hypothetical protein
VALCAGVSAAQAPQVAGTWRLNASKSSWGHKPQPTSVVVKIEGGDPEYRYSGTITDANGEESRFDVACPVDGQEHAVKTSYGPGKMTIRRVNAYTTTASFKSDDGKYFETATTTVSRDGRELTRRVQNKGPDGSATWTEVYDRQQ